MGKSAGAMNPKDAQAVERELAALTAVVQQLTETCRGQAVELGRLAQEVARLTATLDAHDADRTQVWRKYGELEARVRAIEISGATVRATNDTKWQSSDRLLWQFLVPLTMLVVGALASHYLANHVASEPVRVEALR